MCLFDHNNEKISSAIAPAIALQKHPHTHALRTHNSKRLRTPFAPEIQHAHVRSHFRTHARSHSEIKGGCQSGRKVVTHDSKSDLPLGTLERTIISKKFLNHFLENNLFYHFFFKQRKYALRFIQFLPRKIIYVETCLKLALYGSAIQPVDPNFPDSQLNP